MIDYDDVDGLMQELEDINQARGLVATPTALSWDNYLAEIDARGPIATISPSGHFYFEMWRAWSNFDVALLAMRARTLQRIWDA